MRCRNQLFLAIVEKVFLLLAAGLLFSIRLWSEAVFGRSLDIPYANTMFVTMGIAWLWLWFSRRRLLNIITCSASTNRNNVISFFMLSEFHVPAFLGLAWGMYKNLVASYGLMAASELVNPETVNNTLVNAWSNGCAQNDSFICNNHTYPYHNIQPYLDLQPQLLFRWFPLGAPIAMCGTFIVCTYSVMRHVKQFRKPENFEPAIMLARKERLRVVVILVLPLFFGSLCLSSLVEMWQVMCFSFGAGEAVQEQQGWGLMQWIEFEQDLYEENNALADVFESICLYVFGNLMVNQMFRQHVSSEMLEMKHVEGEKRVERLKRISSYAAWERASPLGDHLLPGDGGQQGGQKGINATAQDLALSGISSFLVSCSLTFTYVALRVVYIWFNAGDRGSLPDHTMNTFTLGLGFATSCTAIGNILIMEKHFGHSEEWAEFRANLKFWATKILVTLAFIQGALVQVLFWFMGLHKTDAHTNLFTSALMCYECFFISVLHLFAWPAEEGWYWRAAVPSPLDPRH